MREHVLWVEKYRPEKISDCILPDSIKSTFQEFANQGKIPNLLISGSAGVGKTTIANSNVTHVYNVYMTEETPAAELRGHFIPRGTSWEWMHGPAIRAWMEGSRLVINEINAASGDALDFLLAVLDDKSMAGITLPNGESVKPHPGFNCVATMNGQPEDLPLVGQRRLHPLQDGLVHAGLRILQKLGNGAHDTRVPMRSPRTALAMAPER